MLQGADLEHIRVIPTFTQGRVGEDKPGRLLKGQQPFLIFQNQVIGGNIIGQIRSALDRTVYAMPLFIDTEIAFMHIVYIDRIQISQIVRVKQCAVLIQNRKILLLENFSVLTQKFIAFLIVLAIFCHLINEEQRKRLDAHFETFLLFFKVRFDGFTDLHPAHIIFGHVTCHIVNMQSFPIRKSQNAGKWINFRNDKPFVLFHLVGEII